MVKITCFGEVLWDVFPKHKKIGGAPLNVACRLASFGNDVSLISSIGNDDDGKKISAFMDFSRVNTALVQINDNYKTGKVKVVLDEKGSASYTIEFPRAWDFIEASDRSISNIRESDAFIFGSLVTRNDVSKETLYELLKHAKYKVFDVNLRAPHYTEEILIHLMHEANFIKFNDDELFEISKYLGSKYNSIEQNIKFISEKTNTAHICVTKGSHGAVLLYNDALYYNSGYLIKVVDTVGAGDSFLATLIHYLLNNESPQKAVDTACAVGALVAQSEGANPEISLKDIEAFVNPD